MYPAMDARAAGPPVVNNMGYESREASDPWTTFSAGGFAHFQNDEYGRPNITSDGNPNGSFHTSDGSQEQSSIWPSNMTDEGTTGTSFDPNSGPGMEESGYTVRPPLGHNNMIQEQHQECLASTSSVSDYYDAREEVGMNYHHHQAEQRPRYVGRVAKDESMLTDNS
jgi:hypothetical protein